MQPEVDEGEEVKFMMQPESTLSGKIYAFGGWNGAAVQDQTWKFDLTSWISKTVMTGARYLHACAITGDSIYVLGGEDAGANAQDNNWLYSISGDSWTTKTVMPATRFAHSAVVDVTNGNVYVMGGSLSGTNWVYNITGNSWNSGLTAFPSSAVREFHAAVHDGGNYIYVLGGLSEHATYTGETNLWRYSISGDSWTALTAMPDNRYKHAAVLLGNYIYVFGGEKTLTRQNTTWRYSISGDSWATMTIMPEARSEHCAVVIGANDIYILGGSTSGGTEATVKRYNVPTDSWFAETSMPSARLGFAACGITG